MSQESMNIEQLSSEKIADYIRLIEDLKFFLATGPANWQQDQVLRRYYLNHDEGFVTCVFWNNLYFITGTDIVRCIVYKFQLFGREILDRKKFEEGIFSDLRSLKCGTNAILENSKSPFLNFLFKNACLRTQKKQKVFFWYSVPHDTLFADALERDLKKEANGGVGTTKAIAEPALSFNFDETVGLNDQLTSYVEEQRRKNEPLGNLLEEEEEEESDDSEVLTSIKKPNTFVIKEENNTPVVEESNYDDDFPLDYFPQDEMLTFDPQVFFNPPTDNFDDSLLIDQTYTKTPFKDTTFGDKLNKKVEKEEEEEEEEELDEFKAVPVSSTPYYLPPQSARAAHFFHQQFAHQQQQHPYNQITNAQYYDSQLSGEPLDLSNYPEDLMQQSLSQQQQHIQQQQQPSFTPSAFYGNYQQQTGMINPFYDPYVPQVIDPLYLYGQYHQEVPEDEFDNSFEVAYPQQGQFLHVPGTASSTGGMMRMVSPFKNYFPSFEAMNPPKSARRGKFGMKSGKPRVLKTDLKPKNTPVIGTKLNKMIKKGNVRIVENKSTTGQEEGEGNNNDDEYNTTSLPTPESTAFTEQK